MRATGLLCNDLPNPLGVETPRPLLSWRLEGGTRQSAYQIVVTDWWDSGRVDSDRCLHIPYAGRRLPSRQRCEWRVRVWDESGQEGEWSTPATWEMALLKASDWRAQWIAGERLDLGAALPPAPVLRRWFTLKKPVATARVYVSGLGYYELLVNDRRSGDEVLAPAFSRYDATVYYQTHDVTALLQTGANELRVLLGNGWYNCHTKEVWNFQQAPWRDQPKLLLQLHVRYADGSETVIGTDPQWEAAPSAITFDGLRNGEFYDARLEQPTGWKRAVVVPAPGGRLRSQQHPPIRVTRTIPPVGLQEVRPGTWVYDLGQNISGWAQLKTAGPAGTTITVRYAEKRRPDGDIDPANINIFIKSGEFQTDKFTLAGTGVETWEPRFTYHGYRYAQVTGWPGTPTLDNLRGRVVHTDLPVRGEFECSNELLNAIQRCVRWSTLTNFHGIPTDCPHREKNGWTGDAHISAEQLLLNFDGRTAYRKWLGDFRDCQRPSGQLPGIVPTGGWGYNWGSGPAWDSAALLIPWYLYLYDGDADVFKEHYDCMRRYVDYMGTMANGHLVDFGLGDWCPPVGGPSAWKCPSAVTDSAYYFVDAQIVARAAAVLGKRTDARHYAKLAGQVRAAWRKKFLDPKTGIVTGNCQTAMACALYQGLVDDAEKPQVVAALVAQVEAANRHLDTGFLGTKYLLHALTEAGRADLAYAITTQTDFPSWGDWLRQGATTLWETWNGDSSHNHHAFSDISTWFYKGLAGIHPDPTAPGFKHILIRPHPVGDLHWVRAWHDAPYGRIESRWERSGEVVHYHVAIPPNSTATIQLPGQPPVKVGAGHHDFTAAG